MAVEITLGTPQPADRVEHWLTTAGFVDVRVTPKPESRELIKTWAPGRNLEDHIVSAMVEARKPVSRAAER